jgi:transposase
VYSLCTEAFHVRSPLFDDVVPHLSLASRP